MISSEQSEQSAPPSDESTTTSDTEASTTSDANSLMRPCKKRVLCEENSTPSMDHQAEFATRYRFHREIEGTAENRIKEENQNEGIMKNPWIRHFKARRGSEEVNTQPTLSQRASTASHLKKFHGFTNIKNEQWEKTKYQEELANADLALEEEFSPDV